ncbi:MAG: type II toxin-antitoxin system HicA family toxin [Gammaproteobacteria bacterium]|nr:type II toxin-antitoxin system HicA family toxin [Gammaproteobacteria bacterium]
MAKILESLGFKEVRQKESHKRYRHPDGRSTTLPIRRGRDVSPIVLRLIRRDIDSSVEDFGARR